jgi:microtubule-associated protein-like 6
MWMNTSTFTQVPASSAKAIGDDYASFTGCFGWQVKGIWKPFSDFTDVNGTCRSHSRNFLATADDFGQVNIYKYPCTVEKGAIYSSYLGHSSHVTKVRFSANDRYLVSTGGHDKTVLIWENSYGVVPLEPSAEEENVMYFEEESKANNG